MIHRIKCSRCRPGRVCLSHTRIPFDGTCWVQAEEEQAIIHTDGWCERKRHQDGRSIRDGFGRYLVSIRNHTFDALPLRYLDWLTGQPWLYGMFAKRLYAYLRHPAIDRELDELFPDPEDDSRNPVFLPSADQTSCQGINATCPRWHRWHGQPLKQGEGRVIGRDAAGEPIYDAEVRAWQPPAPRRCFNIVIEAIVRFEDGNQDCELPIEDEDKADYFARLAFACKHVEPAIANRARQAYRTWVNTITDTKEPKPVNARTKLKTVKRKNFATCGLRQELKDDGSYLASIRRARAGRSGKRAHPAYLQERLGIAG